MKTTSGDLVPEMHDIGKLVDKSIMGNGHNFTNIDKSYKDNIRENANWKAIMYHHGVPPPEYRDDLDLFLLKLADHMASAVSRMLQEEREKKELKNELKKVTNYKDKGERKSSIRKLWQTKEEITELISDSKKLLEMIDYINSYSSNDFNLYFEAYGEELKKCPEDKMPGLNVTSLSTHSKLVGNFYRFFKKYKDDIKDNETTLGQIRDVKRAENNFVIKLIHGKMGFHLAPVRARDLNIFTIIERITKSLKQRDEVLFCTTDEFLAVLPPDKDIKSIVGEIEENMYLDVKEAKTVLYEAYPTPVAVKNRFERNKGEFRGEKKFDYTEKVVYPVLSTQIHDICDLCQMYEAKKEFPKDYVYDNLCEKCRDAVVDEEYPFPPDKLCDNCRDKNEKWLEETIYENLCINCFNLRKEDPRAPKIIEWSESDEYSRVAWIKINLKIEELQRTLEKLYERYLKEKGFEKRREGEIRFSVISEFQSDYDDFLKELMMEDKEGDKKELRGKLVDEFKSVNCQWILSDFFCIKIEKTRDLKEILEIFKKSFSHYFLKFKEEEESPIQLSISCSNIKFPFFWHWKFLENPESDVDVNLVGKGELHLSMKQLDVLLSPYFKQPGMSTLYKLGKVAEVSKRLSKILLYDKGDYRLYKESDGLRKLVDGGIDFQNLLTYAKMMSAEEV